jgi:hypothetical protein
MITAALTGLVAQSKGWDQGLTPEEYRERREALR